MAERERRTVSATVKYGSELIPVEVDFGRRKRLTITVNPDQSVLVKAPRRESLSRVLDFAQQRAPWIFEHRRRFELIKPLPLAQPCVPEAALLYLGQPYRLQVIPDPAGDVTLRDADLVLRTTDSLDPAVITALVERWYLDQARVVFAARLELCGGVLAQLGVARPALRVRRMSRSWGTCSAKGWINLNSALVKTPLDCIDYVICHELCHLLQHNHSPAFYRLLGGCLPDWRQRKDRLDRYVL